MQALLDEKTAEQVAREFERGVLESTIMSVETQLRDGTSKSTSLPVRTGGLQWKSQARRSPAELMTVIALYGVQLPPPIRWVSAGCIEAMKFINQRITKTSTHTPLDAERLGLVASCFSSPQRLQLIEEQKTPEDPDLRELLSDWGPAFLLCVHAIGSRWPAVTSSSRGEGVLRQKPAGKARETEWTEDMNARRCALIDRKIQGIISEEEADELESLQQALRRYVNRVAPLPFDAARQLHAELLKKQQAQS